MFKYIALAATIFAASNAMAVERWQDEVICRQVHAPMGGWSREVRVLQNVANRRVIAVVRAYHPGMNVKPSAMTFEITQRKVSGSVFLYAGRGFALRLQTESFLPTMAYAGEMRIGSLAGGQPVAMSCDIIHHVR